MSWFYHTLAASCPRMRPILFHQLRINLHRAYSSVRASRQTTPQMTRKQYADITLEVAFLIFLNKHENALPIKSGASGSVNYAF